MADPGRFQYVLDGKPLYFINENDNKIIIRSEAPTVDIDESGIVRPTTAALAITETTPFAIGIVEPATASLTLSGKFPNIPESNDDVAPAKVGVALAGKVPTLNASVLPGVGSLTITEYSPARWTGLWFETTTPTVVIAGVEAPAVKALTFASDAPDVSSSSATAITRLPAKKIVALTGYAPVAAVSNVTLPTVGALTLFGRLTFVTNDWAYPPKRSVGITGYQPDVIGEGQVGVIIEGPFNYGTFIRNKWATTDVESNYQIDDRTGFKIKVKDPMVEEYTGHMVRPESVDKRSEQEFLRSRPENQKGPLRPEPVGDERFIEDEYPDGVTADDL